MTTKKTARNDSLSRRNLIRSAVGVAAGAALPSGVIAEPARPRKLADAGWCWDGQAINGQWQLSIFGAGEGTKWSGLRRCCFMFHPNTPLAMEKLRDMDEVVCEISKWEYQKVDVLKALAGGLIQGYSILGGFLIDLHPEQATWVHDFIRAN